MFAYSESSEESAFLDGFKQILLLCLENDSHPGVYRILGVMNVKERIKPASIH